MQITKETTPGNLIRAVEPARVRIGDEWLTGNLILTAETIVRDWTVAHPERLTIDDLVPALRLEPELIVVGLGYERTLPDVDLMTELAAQSIGLECMHTRAACRTFNVLAHEGRRVAAALILDAAGSPL